MIDSAVRLKWEAYLDFVVPSPQRIGLVDVLLVGSQVKSFKANSDFDTIFIFKDTSTSSLLKIQRGLEEQTLKYDPSGLFSIKIFDTKRFCQCSKYDGFRIEHFRRFHHSLFNSDILNNVSPLLDKDNFANSISIQLLYNYFKFFGQEDRIQKQVEAVNKWIKINNSIKNLFPFGLSQICKVSPDVELLYQYTTLSRADLAISEIERYLPKYFDKYEHEYINKSKKYSKILKNELVLV